MLRVEDYGSDSEGEATVPTPTPGPSGLNLPPPGNNNKPTPPSHSSLSLPPPRSKPPTIPSSVPTGQKKKKKILLDLPKLTKGGDDDDEDDLEDERPTAKRPRMGGSSALLSMLPAPKKVSLTPAGNGDVKPERVLGAGAGRGAFVFSSVAKNARVEEVNESDGDGADNETEVIKEETTTTMLPPSLLKGKGKVKETKAVPPMDFFSLGSTVSSRSSLPTSLPTVSSASNVSTSSTPLQFTAAPQIDDFRPPSPTPTDPYPGYYQLPSGSWAAYDPEYYKTYYDRWQKEYNAHIRSLEKNAGKDLPQRHPNQDEQPRRGFENAGNADSTTDVDAADQLDEARKAREEKMALTKGALLESEPQLPRMKITASKMSGLARSRHQLGTLLMEAYTNREAIEEKIAQGKRNRKEAGNKYGF